MSRLSQLGALVLLLAISVMAAGPSPTRTVYDVKLKNGFSIHHLRHEVIGDNTRLYTDDNNFIDVPTAEISEMIASEESAPVLAVAPELQDKKQFNLNEVVSAASGKHRIDPDFITSVIRAESRFNPRAVSPKGAQGLMQLMPGTASQLGVRDAFDPFANVDAGTQYLRDLLVKYDGDIARALAAYNAGPARVAQFQGVPPYRETRAYVTEIIKDFNRKKLAERSASKTTASKTPASSSNMKGK